MSDFYQSGAAALELNVFGEYEDPEARTYQPAPVKTYVITDEMRRLDAQQQRVREQAGRSAWRIRSQLSVDNLTTRRSTPEPGRQPRVQVVVSQPQRRRGTTLERPRAIPAPLPLVRLQETVVETKDLHGETECTPVETIAPPEVDPRGDDTGAERLRCLNGCGRHVTWHNATGHCGGCTRKLVAEQSRADSGVVRERMTLLKANTAAEHEMNTLWSELCYQDKLAVLEACVRGGVIPGKPSVRAGWRC